MSLVDGSGILLADFTVKQGTVDLPAKFTVKQDTVALKGIFIVRQSSSAALKGILIVRHTATTGIKGILVVRHTAISDLYAKFEAQATVALKGIFETAQWEDLKGILVARQASIVALKGVFIVRHTATKDLYAKFTSQAVKDLYTKLIVRHSSGYPYSEIKSTFSLYKPYANLFSKIRVRGAGTAELKAVFRVTAEILSAVFHVGQDSETLHGFFHVGQDSAKLKGAFDVGQNHGEIYAQFEAQAVRNLCAKFEVQHCALLKAIFIVKQGTRDLYAKFEAQAIAALYAKFTPKRSASNALKAEFEIGLMLNQSLKAVFTVKQETENLLALFRVRSTLQDMYNLIGYNMPELLNDVENIGRGFIGSPAPLQTESGTPTGRTAVKAVSSHGAGQYKEIRFGWRKEDPIYDVPPCICDIEYEDLILEEWDWDERSYITSITHDTCVRLHYNREFGVGGWTLANINYGTQGYLKCSYFDFLYTGESWAFGDRYHFDDEEIFIRFNIGAPSLTRLGYARIELYRYDGRTRSRNQLELRRIAECTEIPETYIYWNPANVIGGCDYPPLKNNVWSETFLNWFYTGRSTLNMGGALHYMGLPKFLNDLPEIYYGLSAENNEWDMIELTDILEAWVNGSYKNLGVGIIGERIDASYDDHAANGTGDTQTYYSSKASDPRKPRILLQYIPEKSYGKWVFRDNRGWAINTTDPYAGDGSLRLRDWSKLTYDRQESIAPAVTYETTKALAEGKIETKFRLNRDDWPQLKCSPSAVVCYPQEVSPAQPIVDYTTPLVNQVDIYFRYQDASNYYRIRIRPRSGTSSLIRRVGASNTTLETWTTAINIGEWKNCRFFWALNEDGNLIICGKMWNQYLERWRLLFTYTDSSELEDGGDVRIESWDADIDDTLISEVI